MIQPLSFLGVFHFSLGILNLTICEHNTYTLLANFQVCCFNLYSPLGHSIRQSRSSMAPLPVPHKETCHTCSNTAIPKAYFGHNNTQVFRAYSYTCTPEILIRRYYGTLISKYSGHVKTQTFATLHMTIKFPAAARPA